MRIWVDADACPNVIKDILFRAAERRQLALILVANHFLVVPPSRVIRSVQVPGGFDAADRYIVEQLQENDLVITADIPLAADVIAKNAHALNPRGEFYTKDNIKDRLAMRDLMDELRSAGQVSGGPAPFGQRDKQDFANALDRFLAKY
ncbi:YaiI/YqxD family protein [Methylobacter sp. Wu1]|uniref:YaiI/YqxD family protein n=1 Tax=Methylobacter sp. Wu1 TaxID=3119359 RepID=UPI002F94AFDC